MDKNERDMHFQGFAKLLCEEVYRLPDVYIEISDFSEGHEHLQTLIAQRAYDFKQHIMRHLDDHELQESHIPDMIAWPEPGTEQEQDIF